MAKLYSSIDKYGWVYEPNFTRSRARYRGPRESYYLNREIAQLVYDIRKLYEKFDSLDTTLSYDLEALESGGAIGGTYYFWVGKSLTPLIYDGMNDLSVRISKLKQRVKSLEKEM